MDYQYKHVELALAEVFYVIPLEMPAFRARLRHLRNLGLPLIEGPGSGQRISYKRSHILQLLFALEIELHGTSPQAAVEWAKSKDTLSTIAQAEKAAKEGRQGFFMVSDPKFSLDMPRIISSGKEVEFNRVTEHRRLITDLSKSIKILDEQLKRFSR